MNLLAPYRDRIVQDVKLARPMKIVVDSGNGMAGASAPGIFRALGCEVIELYSEVDGNFPNHHPDPSKLENLRDLIAAIGTHKADLGLAFDGDGDRLGIITRGGNNIYPDRQMMLFAQDVLTRVPGGTILFDVKCTQRLAPAIREAGGVPLMYKTGHSLIKAKMKEMASPLGGEMSGHIFFKERWFGFDDGTYAGARLLEILSRHADPSAVLDGLPTSFSTPELNVKCAEGEPHALVDKLVASATLRSAGPGFHHRRRAGRLARRLRPDPCVQHHAGAGVAFRGPHRGSPASDRARHAGAAAAPQARREDRAGGALTCTGCHAGLDRGRRPGRGSYCGGLRFAPTPLRCSAWGRRRTTRYAPRRALRSNSCDESVYEARKRARPQAEHRSRHRNRPAGYRLPRGDVVGVRPSSANNVSAKSCPGRPRRIVARRLGLLDFVAARLRAS